MDGRDWARDRAGVGLRLRLGLSTQHWAAQGHLPRADLEVRGDRCAGLFILSCMLVGDAGLLILREVAELGHCSWGHLDGTNWVYVGGLKH